MLLGDASFCVAAGAALGAPQARFSLQVQHLKHLCFVLRGSCSTWSSKVSFCMAGAALDASQLGIAGHFFKAQTNHLHYIIKHTIIKTTPSPQHHQHKLIYTTPSTQHHLHYYIIKHWQVQHLEHCHISPSASFLLIPLLLFFVVDCSLFCFVDLFHSYSWMSEDTVNMRGCPVL